MASEIRAILVYPTINTHECRPSTFACAQREFLHSAGATNEWEMPGNATRRLVRALDNARVM